MNKKKCYIYRKKMALIYSWEALSNKSSVPRRARHLSLEFLVYINMHLNSIRLVLV
jgi:hypothetical protein